MGSLYLIKRGPKPDYHKAPFHPVILCDRLKVARWQANWTGDRAWVWECTEPQSAAYGWLLSRWEGLDIDYGHVVRRLALPDGTSAEFWRAYEHPTEPSILALLQGAVWWSIHPIPFPWLKDVGVVYPADVFTQSSIIDDMKNQYGWDSLEKGKPAPWTFTYKNEGEVPDAAENSVQASMAQE